MDVAPDSNPRQGPELLVGPAHRLLHQAEHPELPGREVGARDRAVVQHRPLVGEDLAGRKPRLVLRALSGIGRIGPGIHARNLLQGWLRAARQPAVYTRKAVSGSALPSALP